MFCVRPIIMKNVGQAFRSVKKLSGHPKKLVDLHVDKDGIAVLTLQRPPVNSLNLDTLKETRKLLDEIARNEYKGMIMTSGIPKIFTAGLDILEMYKPDLARAESLWRTVQEVWLKLFGAACVTTAAINGHAPGAGCLLALSCEHRVMVQSGYTIGLNEAAVGVFVPPWTMETLCQVIPMRQAELALTTAKMFTTDEALQVGIIDEIAKDDEDAINKCKKFIRQFDHLSPAVRALAKQKAREGPMKRLRENRQEDIDLFLNHLVKPAVQASLEQYVKQLKHRSQNN